MAMSRSQLSEELLRRLTASLRANQLYSRGHPIISRNVEGLTRAVEAFHELAPSLVVGLVDDQVIVDDMPIAGGEGLESLIKRLRQMGIERITIEKGVTPSEIATLADVVTGGTSTGGATPFPSLPHVRVGRVTVHERAGIMHDDIAGFRRMYDDAVDDARGVLDTAFSEGQPDVSVARSMVDGLAQAVSENRNALLALTALREYNNYTFTHMVNVAILTMAQARSLGINGNLLREFGTAGLLHDIGKIKTPPEVLNKAGRLTPAEYEIMKRHTVDGAMILRDTPDIPTLAPVVAFEHHLRLDGTGYPDGARRSSLNLGTMLCSIADVYDAMRSKRVYQETSPTARILAVLNSAGGHAFDPRLVRRFGQLIGVYPVGNMVKLSTGEIAVVTQTHAPDPRHPQVRVVADADGRPVTAVIRSNLWERVEGSAPKPEIIGLADPGEVGVDLLALL
jgi:putative nucleotidyltransferase with HDIG domain